MSYIFYFSMGGRLASERGFPQEKLAQDPNLYTPTSLGT
jgi:hypothetical protein